MCCLWLERKNLSLRNHLNLYLGGEPRPSVSALDDIADRFPGNVQIIRIYEVEEGFVF